MSVKALNTASVTVVFPTPLDTPANINCFILTPQSLEKNRATKNTLFFVAPLLY